MARNLGAIERPSDDRDFLLGSVQAPIQIPDSYIPDIAWFQPNYQGETPACGAHAASHLQAILEHQLSPNDTQHYTPRYIWTRIKQIDGFPLADGTDMRSILKTLQNKGAADFEPLENNVALPLAQYSDPAAITPDIDANAAGKKIQSYVFENALDFQSLCQAIYQNKAVLLLIKVDDGFWGTATPTFTNPQYGHFVTAYGYSPTAIYIVDSADPNIHLKQIAKQYIRPGVIFEAGLAIDIPPAQIKALVNQAVQTAQTVVQSNDTPQQKVDILTAIFNYLKSLFPKVGSTSQSSMFSNESKFWNWLVVSSQDPTKVAATVKGIAGTAIALLAFTVHGPDFSTVPADVYTIVVDAFGVFSGALATVGLIRKVYNTLTNKNATPSA